MLVLAAVVSCKGQKTTTVGTTPEIEKRVESLLSKMTLAEKIGQMNQVSVGKFAHATSTQVYLSKCSRLRNINPANLGKW